MSWQIFVRATAEADLENLDEGDRQALAFDLFSWAESGPRQETRRDVLGDVARLVANVPSCFTRRRAVTGS